MIMLDASATRHELASLAKKNGVVYYLVANDSPRSREWKSALSKFEPNALIAEINLDLGSRSDFVEDLISRSELELRVDRTKSKQKAIPFLGSYVFGLGFYDHTEILNDVDRIIQQARKEYSTIEKISGGVPHE
jgi:hypothetical protein